MVALRTASIGIAAALLLLLAGCSAVSVHTDYDENIDFSTYQTYAWLTPSGAGGSRPRHGPGSVQSLKDKRVREAVDAVLAGKGYRRVRARRADFKVRYFASVRDKVQVQNDEYGWGRFRHNEVSVYQYKEGSLVIDFIDPRLKQLIWRGVGTRSVSNADKAVREIDITVSKTLASFPAVGGGSASAD